MQVNQCKDWKKLKIGDFALEKRKVTTEDIKRYGEISGDYNPVHFDEKYASTTKFSSCIAHGLFCLGLISKIIGMNMPGEGSIFVNESLEYIKPCFVDDEITGIVTILKMDYAKALIKVKIECFNQSKDCILRGESLLKII